MSLRIKNVNYTPDLLLLGTSRRMRIESRSSGKEQVVAYRL